MSYIITNNDDSATKHFAFNAVIEGDQCISIEPLTIPTLAFHMWLSTGKYYQKYSFFRKDSSGTCIVECPSVVNGYGIKRSTTTWTGSASKDLPLALIECIKDYEAYRKQQWFKMPTFDGFKLSRREMPNLQQLAKSSKYHFGDYVLCVYCGCECTGIIVGGNEDILDVWISEHQVQIKSSGKNVEFLKPIVKTISEEREVLVLDQ